MASDWLRRVSGVVWLLGRAQPTAHIASPTKATLASVVYKGVDDVRTSYCLATRAKLGDGVCTRFWSDVWISDVPLRDSFPRLFALETDKDASVAVKLGAGSIASSFRREVRDGVERHQWSDLISIVDSVFLSSSKDRWICDLSGDDWEAWFLSFRLSPAIKSLLEGVFCVAWWRIWSFRNRSIFM
ncbi:hypothetical protein CTI12_AA562300 [Artemisia annua]|uniref:RNA-directed DNA polymerase, eukaryota, Reverse transcriptase zinc-binding domain protein n=1 Tax=Artemisia annua TaxID=35608 RepID=A0A2U1KUP0_ARTAN|nr:hypothetical protein CTI12_AA562300 [Artemisia annua]